MPAARSPKRRDDSADLQAQLDRLQRLVEGVNRLDRQFDQSLKQFERRMIQMLETTLERQLAQWLPKELQPFAGILTSSLLPQFANGGVVDGAQILALGGEAGPEAVLPLKRGIDGKLGVSAEMPTAPIINLTVNMSPPNSGGEALDEAFDNPDLIGQLDMIGATLSAALDQAIASQIREALRDGGVMNRFGQL